MRDPSDGRPFAGGSPDTPATGPAGVDPAGGGAPATEHGTEHGTHRGRGPGHYEVALSEAERRALSSIRHRAVHLVGPVGKTDLLRACVHALARMGDDSLCALLRGFRASERPAKRSG